MRSIKLFEEKKVRSIYNEQEGKWYFSVIDIIQVLTDSSVPKRYWSDLKKKLSKEGSQAYDNIVHLKMTAEDGKNRVTDKCYQTRIVANYMHLTLAQMQ